ncbi:hypothetical protein AVEN_188021-1 [Araneus ventricosus]|uniref:Uncharacterized protein n=1 Tax=Araneus ventricosus TaxID=182803 RepID=A0A4Y2VXE7_ARAVE|nr:hypothetical protein AVEN_188021-1 [Araneus ventricosus]
MPRMKEGKRDFIEAPRWLLRHIYSARYVSNCPSTFLVPCLQKSVLIAFQVPLIPLVWTMVDFRTDVRGGRLVPQDARGPQNLCSGFVLLLNFLKNS